MKKILFLMSLVTLMGVGCPSVGPTLPTSDELPPEAAMGEEESSDAYRKITWEFDPFLGEICLDGGDLEIASETAEALGYPDEVTDHLCVSGATSVLLAEEPVFGDGGSADVLLGELELVSEEQGRIYMIDVLKVRSE